MLAAAIIKASEIGVGSFNKSRKASSVAWWVDISQNRVNSIPMSPMRLYKTAWRAAVPALSRAKYQPISKKDMIPTPSQPMKRIKRFSVVVKTIIIRRKISMYLKNREILGSSCMYHKEKSMILHVTSRAIGINRVE